MLTASIAIKLQKQSGDANYFGLHLFLLRSMASKSYGLAKINSSEFRRGFSDRSKKRLTA
jgi:hypothetical protein